MNINLLKTFLEVARLGHFGKAADRVCLTQAAVSARIKQIEDKLGVTLFTRKRNNIQLTAEGRRLAVAAEKIVKQWELAKNEIGMASYVGQQLIRIGTIFDIWSILPADWLATKRKEMPDLLFQVQAYSAPLLLERLLSDEVDIAMMFDPPYHPAFEVTDLGHIDLRLYATRKSSLKSAGDLDYIYVDWGESYSGLHQQQLGDVLKPVMNMNMSSLAIGYLARNQGMAYLPVQGLGQSHGEPRFFEVEDAPAFQRGICYVYRKGHAQADILRQLLPTLQ